MAFRITCFETFQFFYLCCWFSKTATTISLKVFLFLLEHLLSKSGGDCTFIHQFLECQREYRVFFTLILMKWGAEIEKWEGEWRSQHVCYCAGAQRTIFRQQWPLYTIYVSLFWEKYFCCNVNILYGPQKQRESFKLVN